MTARAWRMAGTMRRLGIGNVLRVGAYRALLKAGVYRRLLPAQPPLFGPFFDWSGQQAATALPAPIDMAAWAADAQRVMGGELPVFSDHWVRTGFPPRWQRSVLTGVDFAEAQRHWTDIPDFALPGGDVKGYWEPARFDGLLILTLGWVATRRDDMARAIDAWLQSWAEHNPANVGIQWKCGQETGLRLMQLLLVAELLARWGSVRATASLHTLLAQHCARIAPTMLYAVGQDNNHGTSEAAALFTAGAFLARHAAAPLARRGEGWRATGRHWLENRLARLVLPDGSFSQHSVNYHRVLLDTCSFVETFRRWYGEPPLSARALARCRAATAWLAALTDAGSGDAPNLGANDGARLFVLHRLVYRDFRPAVQWASLLFRGHAAYPAGACDEPLAWLGLEGHTATAAVAPAAQLWPDGGYARLAAAPRAWALLRLPRFRFRPSHADALHLDLWVDGRNLLCDAGTYSYNAGAEWLDYFSGTGSHNTVQFDGRDQMPRLSRFLFGDWLDTEELAFDAAASTITAAYRNAAGAYHRRSVTLGAGRCTVVDQIVGVRERAVLRWRMAPQGRAWVCGERECSDGTLRIAVRSLAPIARFACVEGWQSRHYSAKTPLPVLEVDVLTDTTLTTDITWPA